MKAQESTNSVHKKFVYYYLLGFLLISHLTTAQSLSDLNIADKLVSSWIDDISGEISGIKDSAVRDLDLLTEQRVNQLDVLFQNLRIELMDNLDKKLSDLSLNLQTNIYSIQDIINKGYDNLKRTAKEIDLILNTNLTEVCERLPNFICPKQKIDYSFRYVTGLSLVYSSSKPSFIIETSGNAITNNSLLNLELNGINYSQSNSSDESASFKAAFEIPYSAIRGQFKETEYQSIPIKITSITNKIIKKGNILRKEKRKDFRVNLETELFLLPKFPFTYEIIEHVDTEDFDMTNPIERREEFDTKANSLDDEVTFDFNLNQKFSKVTRYYAEGSSDGYILTPTKEHTYVYACNKGEPSITQNGKIVNVTCRDVMVSTLVPIDQVNVDLKPRPTDIVRIIGTDFLDTRKYIHYLMANDPKSFFTNPPPFPMTSKVSRPGHMYIEYFEKVSSPYNKEIRIVDSSNKLSLEQSDYLTYGSHFTENLVNGKSGFTVKLYPTFYSNKEELAILSSSLPKASIPNIVNTEVREDKAGSTSRLRLEITP